MLKMGRRGPCRWRFEPGTCLRRHAWLSSFSVCAWLGESDLCSPWTNGNVAGKARPRNVLEMAGPRPLSGGWVEGK